MILKDRLRQIMMVGGVETLGVVLGGIAGLLIVNVLPKEQYAAYTFLIACSQLMLGIADTGLAHCCLPVVGQRAHEVPWVVGACRQVFNKRWWLLLVGIVFVTPYWWYTTREHGWSGGGYWLASLLVFGTIVLTLREHFLHEVMMILRHIGAINRIAFASYSVRLLFVGAVLLLPVGAWSLAGLMAATALAGAVALWLYARALKREGITEQALPAETARQVDKEIFRIARPLMLPALFYQFQGVVTVFLVSLFGTTDVLAEIGAFGRLAMILIVFDRVAIVLLFPAIARAQQGPRLLKMVAAAHLAYLSLMALVFLSALWLPQYWMLLLGHQYADRQSLLWMQFLITLLLNSAGFAFRTLAARGHTVRQSWIIPVVIATQLLYLWWFGIADLRAALGFGVATALVNFFYQYTMLAGWFATHRSKDRLA